MTAKILQIGNPILRRKARKISVNQITQPQIQKLIEIMKLTMRNAPGVGLAAPQIGFPLQLVVIEDKEERMMALSERARKEKGRVPVAFHALINPKLTVIDRSENLFFEACLSVDGFSRITPRAQAVEVTYFNEQGIKKTIRAQGWYARILQHEVDHLNGKLYVDIADARTEIENTNSNRLKWLNASIEEVKQFYLDKTAS